MAVNEWVPLPEAARFACQRYDRMYDAVATQQVSSRRKSNRRIEVTRASLVKFCEALVERGKLRREERDGKAIYSPPR